MGSGMFLGIQGWKIPDWIRYLIVTGQGYANLATEVTNSIIYGVMAATPASQSLRINAHLTLTDTDVVLSTATGTKIGTATGQKLAFWDATPVVQQVLATGAGASADDIIGLLQTLGLCKQS